MPLICSCWLWKASRSA